MLSDAARAPQKRASARSFVLALVVANLISLVLGTYDRFVTAGESRAITAGISHWTMGDFDLADDAPPLARMLATLPVLTIKPIVGEVQSRDQCHDPGLWSRYEDQLASDLAGSMLPDAYLDMVRLARLAGYAWWLIGAWVVVRWAQGLYGNMASWLALVLWAFGPNIAAAEVAVDSALPAAVIAAVATYAFRFYLRDPSAIKSAGIGLYLGLALLIDYLLIGLVAAWAIPWAIARRPGSRTTRSTVARTAAGVGRAALLLITCLWAIDLGSVSRAIGSPCGITTS